jgi:hypothetical protein
LADPSPEKSSRSALAGVADELARLYDVVLYIEYTAAF